MLCLHIFYQILLQGGEFMIYKFRKNKKLNIKINAYLCVLLFAFFSLGVSTGCKNFNLTEENYEIVKGYFQGKSDFYEICRDSFVKNSKIIVMILIWGISLAGIPAILYFLFSQGISLGSGICAVLSVSSSDILNTVLNLLPQTVFFLIALMLISYYSFEFSVFICRKILFNGKRFLNNKSIIGLIIAFALSLVLCYFSSLCEGWFIPSLN